MWPGRGRVRDEARLLTRENLDGRTLAAKRFEAVARELAEDLGGADRLSAIQRHLVEAFAGVSIHLSDLHTRMLLGEKINIVEHATAVSTMVRIATRVGVERVQREIEPLNEYLSRKYPGDEDEVSS
jgi:hypothetical protein